MRDILYKAGLACVVTTLGWPAAFGAVDLQALSAQVSSNIQARLERATAKASSVRALASTNNYALLTSTKLKDAATKLALQKQLAEAALADEMETEAGRRTWHGQYTGAKVDLEAGTMTLVYADGTEHTEKFTRPNLVAQVAAANKRLPTPPMTNGVPAALVAARLRRYAEKTTVSNVTVNVEANVAR